MFRTRTTGASANGPSAAFVVEVEFLFAWDGHAVFGCRGEEPLPYSGDHRLVDRRLQAFEQSQLGDFAMFVDQVTDPGSVARFRVCAGAVSNPDLPLRVRKNLPLADYDRKTLYTFDAKGYIDYAPHAEAAV